MSNCTAPTRGHRTSSAAAACPACSSRSSRYYGSYSSPSYTPSYSSYGSSGSSSSGSGSGRISGGGSSGRNQKPRWSKTSSPVFYTPAEVRTLTPVRENVERRASMPDLRDVFLCHAWDDRAGAAKELHDLLESKGVSVWFSEKDVPLGSLLLREIDKGLTKSKIGIVLVTPGF